MDFRLEPFSLWGRLQSPAGLRVRRLKREAVTLLGETPDAFRTTRVSDQAECTAESQLLTNSGGFSASSRSLGLSLALSGVTHTGCQHIDYAGGSAFVNAVRCAKSRERILPHEMGSMWRLDSLCGTPFVLTVPYFVLLSFLCYCPERLNTTRVVSCGV